MKNKLRIIVLMLAVLALSGCCVSLADGGWTKTTVEPISAGGVDGLAADIRIGVADFNLEAAGDRVMSGEMRYNLPGYRPEYSYEPRGSKGYLSFEQTRRGLGYHAQGIENDVDMRVSASLPMDLDVSMGAGSVDLDLRNAMLSSAQIRLGAGSTKIDLRGDYDHDAQITIQQAVGDCELRLPRDVGVRLDVSGMIDRNISGLRRQGDFWVNDAYGEAEHTLDVDATGAICSLSVR